MMHEPKCPFLVQTARTSCLCALMRRSACFSTEFSTDSVDITRRLPGLTQPPRGFHPRDRTMKGGFPQVTHFSGVSDPFCTIHFVSRRVALTLGTKAFT